MADIRRVLVVGGGVVGLTTAASLANAASKWVLIEKRPVQFSRFASLPAGSCTHRMNASMPIAASDRILNSAI
jgi:glycine/D-amino acid oxidase-like deaminating enzyme